jgi:CheY-like chemotaxis protein
MEPDVVARATEPFFTTKPVGQGTGLGLPTVYGFLRQSGGTMRLTSHPGEGTTVQLYLPRSASAPAGERPATGPVQAQGKGEIVLVVDDDEGVRTTTASLLAELGYAVIDTEKGERALEILKANPGIKLMVADYAMPGMNGAELIARARQARPELKAIVVTGYAQGSELDRVLPVGAVLRKPFSFADLSEALKHAQ